MFFKKKVKELPLLQKSSIVVNTTVETQEEAIRQVGGLLVAGGYVGADYIPGMLAREQSFSTYMGSGLAIPHGVEAAKAQVKQSGIAVLTAPEGIAWGGEEKAQIIIAIASVGESHLELLALVSEKMMDEQTAQTLIHGDVDTIYNILTGEG